MIKKAGDFAQFLLVRLDDEERCFVALILCPLTGVVPLAQASAAYFGAAGRQLGRGKIVITLIEESRG